MNADKYRRLLHASAQAVDLLLRERDPGVSIPESLKLIGEASKADRAYLFLCSYDESGAGRASQAFEWHSAACTEHTEDPKLRDIPFSQLASLFERLKDGHYYDGHLSELPVDMQGYLQSQGMQSFLVLPIMIAGMLWGFVGFDVCSKEREWNDDDKFTLLSYAASIGSAVERSESERALKAAKEAAEEANSSKSFFIANVSHEIRTPLNAILGFSELISERMADPQTLHYIRAIKTAGDSLLSLINNILDLSKMEASRLELQPEAMDLRDFLHEVETVFGTRVKEKSLLFRLRAEPGLPATVCLDQTRLRQIIYNLLGNAYKFTERGSVSVEISAGPELGGRVELSFAIVDTGVGISRELSEAIFVPFTQISGLDSRRTGGTGLGLTISRRLASLMGGRIELASELGKGSRFTLVLPQVEVVSASRLPAPLVAKGPKVFMPADILLIEDNFLNRMVIKGNLKDSGLEVIEAENGLQGLELARAIMPALILLDMQMPEMDGKEVLIRLRNDPMTSTIPVIVQTAGVISSDEEIVRSLCDGFLKKPFMKAELIQLLSLYLPSFEESSIERFSGEGVLEKDRDSHEETNSADLSSVAAIGHFEADFKLAAEFMKEWTEISVLESIDDILAFALRVKRAAARFDDRSALLWAGILAQACESFDLPRAEQFFRDFPSLAGAVDAGLR
jgi:signal transduction histidine kinase/DNA-binding response OmpR family regulator